MKPIHKNIINKWLKLHFYSYDSVESVITQDKIFCKNTLLYFKSSNEFIQINLVQTYGLTIQYIINKGIIPSEKVQLEAVKQNGSAIHYIENPSEKLQLAAVKRDGSAIYYIENPSEKVQIAAVNQNGWAIYHIKNPSEKVQLAAVKESYEAIIHIINPYLSVIELYEKLSGKKYEKKY
jgi:hypothetical protein